ncbi:MAG TPA: hypothetical protein VES69_12535, partial [Pyrinomonadaceae bacterium]|nr:hypothetical protein [Pyrinomonadaceae bacterium]
VSDHHLSATDHFSFAAASVPPNAALQLRRAISISLGKTRLLEKHAIAPSDCKRLLDCAVGR